MMCAQHTEARVDAYTWRTEARVDAYTRRTDTRCDSMGRFEDALRDAEICLTLKPEFAKALFRRGQALAAMCDYDGMCLRAAGVCVTMDMPVDKYRASVHVATWWLTTFQILVRHR